VHQQKLFSYFLFLCSAYGKLYAEFWSGVLLMLVGKANSVLIFDGNKSVARAFRRILEKKGCSVDSAETGKEAARKLCNRKYDIALIDVELVDDKFSTLLGPLNSSRKTLRILFSSLPKLEIDIESDFSSDVFLEKPVDPEKLLSIIEEHWIVTFT
jgi:DNA-binding response OmpR family regulator